MFGYLLNQIFYIILNEKIKEGDIVTCVYTGVNNDMLMAKRI